MADGKFYVTTPIYYVNDKPHIGHAYTTILADVLARYHRLLGCRHILPDRHGRARPEGAGGRRARRASRRRSRPTAPWCRFQELWKKLEITNDDFIRTTEERHKTVVQQILQDLYDRDEIYRAEYDGWYCVPCERFFTEKDLVGRQVPGVRPRRSSAIDGDRTTSSG